MVAASWSHEELALMLRAWDDALDVPPHRGFRLLDFMFRRFTELCGGHTDRTVGSMTIKRKYMRNMVDVIAQFNNLHGRNGDGLDPEEYDEEGVSVAVTAAAGSSAVDTTSLVSSDPPSQFQQMQQTRWFEMKRSERKQWFLRLNTKSYQFANIDEETFSSVYKLMQIERVVYGDATAADGEGDVGADAVDEKDGKPQKEERQVAGAQTVCRRRSASRVPLVRDSIGNWTATQRLVGPESRPTVAPSSSGIETTAATSARATSTSRVSAESGTRLVVGREADSAFDRLLASSSGRRGDVVMIDAGSWTDDSDSDTNTSVDSGGEDDDSSYDWSQGERLASLHFQDHGERGPRTAQAHPSNSEQTESNGTLDTGSGDLHSDQAASLMHFTQQRRQERPAPNPQLLSAVQSLEAQAVELKDILTKEREKRQREEQLWEAEKLRRDTERRRFKELLAQMSSANDPEQQTQQEDTKCQGLRNEVLALIRSEEEERRKEDEVEKTEQEEHDQFLREIKRDDKKRMKFDQVRKREQAENATLVEVLKQVRSERQRKITERAEILNQFKLIRSRSPDHRANDTDGESPGTQSQEPNDGVAADRSNKDEDAEPQSQAPERRRSLRGSKATQDGEEGRTPDDSSLQSSRTRRKQAG